MDRRLVSGASEWLILSGSYLTDSATAVAFTDSAPLSSVELKQLIHVKELSFVKWHQT
jgi:hypothetical protein